MINALRHRTNEAARARIQAGLWFEADRYRGTEEQTVAIGAQMEDVTWQSFQTAWTQLNGMRSRFAQLASRGEHWIEEEPAYTFSIGERSKCILGGASTIALTHVGVWTGVAVVD